MTSFALVSTAQNYCRETRESRWESFGREETLVGVFSHNDVAKLGMENLERLAAEVEYETSEFVQYDCIDWRLEELSHARANEVLAILKSKHSSEYAYMRWNFEGGELVWDLLTAMLDPIFHGAGKVGYVDIKGVKY